MTFREIPQPGKRKKPSLTEKLAAALRILLEQQPAPRSMFNWPALRGLTAKQFCALFEFDHEVEHALYGADDWTNLRPLYKGTGEHREKTRKRAPVLAKARRQRKKEESHRDRVLAKYAEGTNSRERARVDESTGRRERPPEHTFKPRGRISNRPFSTAKRPMRRK